MKKTTISLTLVLATALFTMGAKWAEKPIDSLATVAGTWSGAGTTPTGAEYTIKYWFRKDGSLKYSRIKGTTKKKGTKDVKKGPGALWIEAGKLHYESGGAPWSFTLYENKKGKHMLRGERPDGGGQQLTRAK